MSIAPTRSDSLAWTLTWVDEIRGEPVRTVACLSLCIDGNAVWPVRGDSEASVDGFADDPLSHLSEFWRPLILRQVYPLGVEPTRPSAFRHLAEERWSASWFAGDVEAEETVVDAFEEAHNFSNAFSGQFELPPLWIFRSGNEMVVETKDGFWALPLHTVIGGLEWLGNRFAERLQPIDRYKKLLSAWRNRDAGDAALLLSLSTGLPLSSAESLLADKILTAPVSVSEAANDNELRVAARMAGGLPLEHLKALLVEVGRVERGDPTILNALSQQVRDQLRSENDSDIPHEQGTFAARWLREYLRCAAHSRVDPAAILQDLCVSVDEISVPARRLDALAIWGALRGPAVLINVCSRRLDSSRSWARQGAGRASAAHELCHLLLDTSHATAAVDVLRGRMPQRLEQRARAFAAELLLPAASACHWWQESDKPRDVEGVTRLLRQLCVKYSVTQTLAAWQLHHGLGSESDLVQEALDIVAPNRWSTGGF